MTSSFAGARVTTTTGFWIVRMASWREAAEVCDPASGRVMQRADYRAGNSVVQRELPGWKPEGEERCTVRSSHAAFCLETQHFPDAPNQPNFPSTELKPGQDYQTTTVFTLFDPIAAADADIRLCFAF